MTTDEKTLVLASDRASAGKPDIYLITRNAVTDTFGTPLSTHLGNVNNALTSKYDPFLTTDGLRLYLASGGGTLQIMVATRPDANSDFGAPVSVPGINNVAGAANFDSALSRDERIIVFSSDRDTRATSNELHEVQLCLPRLQLAHSRREQLDGRTSRRG